MAPDASKQHSEHFSLPLLFMSKLLHITLKKTQLKGMHAAAFLVQIQEQQRHRLPLLSHCLAESTTEQEL